MLNVVMGSSPDAGSSEPGGLAGVHSLVESLYGLQGEKSRLRGELRLLHSQLEEKEQDRHSRVLAFQQQVGVTYSTSAFSMSCHNTHLVLHGIFIIRYNNNNIRVYIVILS